MLRALLKGLGRLLFGLWYRVQVHGRENYERAGDRVLIVANHVSLLDGVLLYLYLDDTAVFTIHPALAAKWFVRPWLRAVDWVAVDPTDPLALKAMVGRIRAQKKAVIFPEDRITRTGALMKIYAGTGVIADKAQAAIVPVGIDGAQHTIFSSLHGLTRRHWWPRIRINILPAERLELPANLHGEARRKAATRGMEAIMLRIACANLYRETTLFDAFIDALHMHGAGRTAAEDLQRGALSYRQLLVRAFALGSAISRQTQAGEHVGVMLPNSTGTLTVFLALHSHGRVPAMLNFTAGAQALITATETASIHVVYTARRFIDNAGLGDLAQALAARVNLVYLEDLVATMPARMRISALLASCFPRFAYRRRHRDRTPDATAAILFTSGSEGIPKGVVLSHRNLLFNCAQTQALIGLNRRDLVFNALPVFHSFGLTAGTLLPLLSGVRIFFYPTPLHYRIIPELCYRLGATVLFGTNTFLAAYAQTAHAYDFHTLRYVVAGAEKLKAETRRVWAEQFGIRILEGYGATEASPVVSVNTPLGNKPGTVGRFLSGIEHYLEPVEGIATGGRLVIRGPNVMKGYLYHGSDGEIAPPASRRGQGWYDTGDIVEVDEDGYLSIVGRARRFAKVGGEMISLGKVEEIAAALWPAVKNAAVAIPDTRKGEAIVLVTQQHDAGRRQFLERVQELGVNELHVPRRFVVVDDLPVLGTGKLDYHKLEELVRQPQA